MYVGRSRCARVAPTNHTIRYWSSQVFGRSSYNDKTIPARGLKLEEQCVVPLCQWPLGTDMQVVFQLSAYSAAGGEVQSPDSVIVLLLWSQ